MGRHRQPEEPYIRLRGSLLFKRCTRCKRVKPAKDFYAAKNSKDGLHVYCITCLKINKGEARDKKRTSRTPQHPVSGCTQPDGEEEQRLRRSIRTNTLCKLPEV